MYFLNLGTIIANPKRSVKIPGVKSTIPPITIKAPSINSSVGGRPLFISLCIRDSVETPCCLAREAPSMPVKTIRPIVGEIQSELQSSPISKLDHGNKDK